jgi:hypothetical protein
MRARSRLRNVIVAGALAAAGGLAVAGQGQGPVEGDVVRVEKLRLGEYWYGAQLTHDDLIGKVVLVELWGS